MESSVIGVKLGKATHDARWPSLFIRDVIKYSSKLGAKVRLLSFTLIFLLWAGLGLASAQTSTAPRLVTSDSRPSVSGGSGSYAPRFSDDGRFITFLSQANNLVSDDDNGNKLDIFLYDLVNRTNMLVSANMSLRGGGDGNSCNPVMSFNGRAIAFESTAGNLVANDTNSTSDVYVRDVASHTISLVSVSADGLSCGNGPSVHPDITPDGRWVAFESGASNLVVNDLNSYPGRVCARPPSWRDSARQRRSGIQRGEQPI